MKNSNPVRFREVWLIMFVLGNIMINFPVIHIFNKEGLVFGYPPLFLYFMLGWPASILVVYFFSRRINGTLDGEDDDQRRKGGS